MKKPVTYIDLAKFEAIATELELPMTPQAGFIKVQGPKGRQVYVAKTKTVGRIDISGFTVDHLGVRDLGEASFGNVRQQINFAGDEAVILGTFHDVLTHMKGLEPLAKTPRKAPSKEAAAPEAVVTETKVAKPEPKPEERLPRTREERQKRRDAKLQAALEAAQQALAADKS